MVQANNLPAQLREHGLFCCWRYEDRDGKPTKVPYNPQTGGRAQSTNPQTFAPLAVALEAMERGGYDGIGVGIFGNLGAIDIDHCLDEAGKPSELARDVAATIHGYTERSPSGKGLRILFTVSDGFTYDKARYYINNQKLGLEVYIAGATNKYVTVTGNAINPGYPLEEHGEQLRAVLEKYMTRPKQQEPPPPARVPGPLGWDSEINDGPPVELDDLELIERAKRSKKGAAFSALWAGNTTGYKSASEADMALCNALVWWAGTDADRVDRLFRQSGLYRPDKWDRPTAGSTYGALTIQNAIATAGGGYDPAAYRRQSAAQDFSPSVPTEPQGDPKPPPTLDTITAADLQKKEIPPIRFIVDKLLTVGLNILASPPKYGKSWMVLDLCLATSTGSRFLGYETAKCECLYLALEDSQRRLKSRMNKILSGKSAPAGFHFATSAHSMDDGLFDELEGFLKAHPDTGLIVIDTLQKVRGCAQGKEGAYATDYREAGALKAFADKHNVSLLVVHHLRKMGDDADPFNRISGTNGLAGAADTMIVLSKEKRSDDKATFSIVGRDVEPADMVLRFNKGTCRWENLGDADWYSEQQARLAYEGSPIVKTIKKLLEQNPDGWKGTTQQLLEAGTYIARVPLADSTQALTAQIKKLDNLLFNVDNIIHERKPNGSGGGKHIFHYADGPQFEEVGEQEEIGDNPF